MNNDVQFDDFDLDDDVLFMDDSGDVQNFGASAPAKEKEEVTQPSAPAPTTAPAQISSNLPIDTGMEEPMLQPPPPVVKKQTSSFYFHTDDEEEAAQHLGPAKSLNDGKRYSLDKIISKVSESFQLNLNQELITRFNNIIFSLLRDRRTIVDFKEVLVRSIESGGMGFSVEQAEKIYAFVKEIKTKIESERGLVIGNQEEIQLKQSEVVKPKSPISNLPDLKPIPKVEAIKKKDDLTVKLEQDTQEAKKEIKPGIVKSLPRFQRPFKQGQMTDVKKDHKLIGPVEELNNLSLDTFRMLGEDIGKRVDKVVSRVELLGQSSLTKKAAGIESWRQSQLYKMYLALGRSSIEHGVNVQEIISQYQSSGKDIMTLEEFEAVSDINKRLRF